MVMMRLVSWVPVLVLVLVLLSSLLNSDSSNNIAVVVAALSTSRVISSFTQSSILSNTVLKKYKPHNKQQQQQQQRLPFLITTNYHHRVHSSTLLLSSSILPSNNTSMIGSSSSDDDTTDPLVPVVVPPAAVASVLSNDEIRRYSRHLVLSNVGMVGQLALKQSAILVVGAGGLGSPVLLYLAAAGVGQIGIVDADIVDVSNLQRQIIHSMSTIHTSKCQSAQQSIQQLNPNVQVRLYEEELTSQTAHRIIGDGFAPNVPWTIVIDGSDNFPTKYLINDICAIYGLPWIYSAILAFEGQVSVFNTPITKYSTDNNNSSITRGPDYRDLLPTPPLPGDVPSCAEGGVLGILPGTMGCIQATEAIKYILGHHDGLLVGRVLCYNALTMKFTEIQLQRNDKERTPITELIDYQGFCGGPKTTTLTTTMMTLDDPFIQPVDSGRTMDETDAMTNLDINATIVVHDITPTECCDKLMTGWTPYVIDVRLESEHEIVHLPFTDCVVPHRTIKVSNVPINGDILLYCKGGVRGSKAGITLIDAGIDPQRIYNLKGGIMQWQQDIDPTMPRY